MNTRLINSVTASAGQLRFYWSTIAKRQLYLYNVCRRVIAAYMFARLNVTSFPGLPNVAIWRDIDKYEELQSKYLPFMYGLYCNVNINSLHICLLP